MLFMHAQISLYTEMSKLSARMVEAARANDWDNLIALERSVAALRNSLIAEEGGGEQLSSTELDLKSQLIQRILDDDAEIRRHTEPWMEQVRQFLGSGSKRRQVEHAYGV